MKKIFYPFIAMAVAILSFASCEDVPMPYNQPNIKPDTTTVEVEPAGTGTAANPYNVAAAVQLVSALEAGEQTPNEIYVKGVVKQIRQIETERYGNANYYITDNGDNQIYIFQSYYLGNRKFTENDKLEVGDTVVVCGKFTNYQGNTPETVGRGSSYIYSLNGKTEGGSTPTISGTPKGTGTEADPFNATAANQAAAKLSSSDKQENVYVSGIVCEVGSFNSKYGELNYYISDDGKSGGDKFYVYNGYGLNGDKFASKDDLKVGQKVTVVGTLINFKGNTPEFQYGSKIVSLEGEGTTTKPDTPDAPTEDADITVSTDQMGFPAKGTATTYTTDGITFTFAKGEGSNDPTYYSGNYFSVRMYAKNTLTIKASKNIASIVITTTDGYQNKHYNGNDQAYAMSGSNKIAITKNSNTKVSFTGLNSSTIQIVNDFESNKGGTQLRIQKIAITYVK